MTERSGISRHAAEGELRDMIPDDDVLKEVAAEIAQPATLRQPPGLFLLFIVEMWERFSYYGMRALLVLYLIALTTQKNPGRGWTEGEANLLYGWYTGLAYLLPMLGGYIADKLLGTHRSMLVGGTIIALGHIVLAITGFGGLAQSHLGMSVFIGGLALIIIGTGYFKPCVSVMVGQLYGPGDPRRDGGFTIFYMGINLGAFICAFVCGTLGERVGWHWGFGAAAVGMLAGLFTYLLFRPRFLAGIGEPPAARGNSGLDQGPVTDSIGRARGGRPLGATETNVSAQPPTSPGLGEDRFRAPGTPPPAGASAGQTGFTAQRPPAARRVESCPNYVPVLFPVSVLAAAGVAGLYYAGFFGWLWAALGKLLAQPGAGYAVPAVLAAVVLAAVAWFIAIQQRGDKGPTASIFIFMLFNAFFWIAFEQAGSTLNVFAEMSTDRQLFSWEVPATWFQSVNPALIILLAPFLAMLWSALGRRGRDPSQPVKIGLGLLFLGAGYVFMVIAGKLAAGGALVGMSWLVLTYTLHTFGELCLSPTGLSFVTKTAPARYVSFLMGCWFISSFLANLGGGIIASYVKQIEDGQIALPWYGWFRLGGRADFFLVFVITSVGAGLVILIFSPLLRRLYHGRE